MLQSSCTVSSLAKSICLLNSRLLQIVQKEGIFCVRNLFKLIPSYVIVKYSKPHLLSVGFLECKTFFHVRFQCAWLSPFEHMQMRIRNTHCQNVWRWHFLLFSSVPLKTWRWNKSCRPKARKKHLFRPEPIYSLLLPVFRFPSVHKSEGRFRFGFALISNNEGAWGTASIKTTSVIKHLALCLMLKNIHRIWS